MTAADYRAGLETFPAAEETSATLEVEGSLPPWLDGTHLRNGPGAFEVGGQALTHWFDGLALVRRYGFDPETGTVDYRVRFLRSETYREARDGRLSTAQFGTPRGFGGLRARLTRLLGPTLTDNASVSFARVGDRLAAVTETPRMVELDPETLATRETFEYDDDLSLTGALGHLHADPARGESTNLGVRYGRQSEYVLTRRPDGATGREVLARLEVDRPSYVHSFALTPDYAVLTLSPWVTRPRDLLLAETFLEAFSWAPERGTRFLVVDRETGAVVARHQTDPFLVFHHLGAFVTEHSVVVDLVAHPDHRAVTGLRLAALRAGDPLPTGRLRRYRLPLDGGRVTSETLHDGTVEFPTLDYGAAVGRRDPHRWAYLAAAEPESSVGLPTRIDRLDLQTGDRCSWARPGTYPGEPLFVPRTAWDGRAETDEGVLLVELLDPAADRTDLVVLDAATLDRRAVVELPHRLPLGFHGQYRRPDHPYERTMA